MNDGFRQRLVGAVVLASILLIMWPVIFSDPNSPLVDRRSQIPEKPAFGEYVVPQPPRPANVATIDSKKLQSTDGAINRASTAPAKAVPDQSVSKAKASANTSASKAKPSSATTKPTAVKSSKPSLDQKGLPVSWVLQVASLGQSSKAKQLQVALQKKGYKAYTTSISTKEGKSTRVYIGPKFSKNAFERDKRIIDKAFKVNSMVVRFEQ